MPPPGASRHGGALETRQFTLFAVSGGSLPERAHRGPVRGALGGVAELGRSRLTA